MLPPKDVTLALVQEHGLLEQLLDMLHEILLAAVPAGLMRYARTVDIERLRRKRALLALHCWWMTLNPKRCQWNLRILWGLI